MRVPVALTGAVGTRHIVGDGGAAAAPRPGGVSADQPHRRHRRIGGRDDRRRRAPRCDDNRQLAPAAPESLAGLRLNVPVSFRDGLSKDVATVRAAVRARLESAREARVYLDVDLLYAFCEPTSFVVVRHESIGNLPPYCGASGLHCSVTRSVAESIVSPVVCGAFEAFRAYAIDVDYAAAVSNRRSAIKMINARNFAHHRAEVLRFPTKPLAATPIDATSCVGRGAIDRGAAVDRFGALVRNIDLARRGQPAKRLAARGMTQ